MKQRQLASRMFAGLVGLGLLTITGSAFAQVPVLQSAPMPTSRQVSVGAVTGNLRRDAVRTQAGRSWATIAGCVQRAGSRVATVRVRFVVVMGQSPQVLLIRSPAGARACIAQEIAAWRFPPDAGIGTAAVTFRTRGIDAALAGAASRTPVAGEVLRGAGQILEAGHEVIGGP